MNISPREIVGNSSGKPPAAQTPRLLNTAEVLAALDLLAALAELAAARNYVRPVLVEEPILDIRDGRHPVLDQVLPPGTFVPNDATFGPDDGTFWLVTGPNMAGKSTFLRQVALITLMAHVGSFVPAKSAKIGCDVWNKSSSQYCSGASRPCATRTSVFTARISKRRVADR